MLIMLIEPRESRWQIESSFPGATARELDPATSYKASLRLTLQF